MYYGKMTDELKQLYSLYEEKFGYTPDGSEQVEYSDIDYDDYVNDIKRSIDTGVHIADLTYPEDE